MTSRAWLVCAAALITSSCVLHATDFLPRTGNYAYLAEEGRADGGRAEFPVLVLTDVVGSVTTCVEVSAEDSIDAGPRLRFADPDSRSSALIYVIQPGTGQLETRARPPVVLLPATVAVGAKWRYYDPGAVGCPLDAQVTAISGDSAQVMIDLACPASSQPYVSQTWQVQRGLVVTSWADGGNVVRFEPR